MTLHDAVAHIIRQADKSLTVQEITDRINQEKLYRRKKDDKPLEPEQVMLRLGNKPEDFSILVSLNNCPDAHKRDNDQGSL